MLRTLARTAVILIVAATVAGGLYLAVPSRSPSPSAGQQLRPDSGTAGDRVDHGRDRRNGGSPGRRGHHGRGDASPGRGVAGMMGTMLQVGAVGAVVVALQNRRRRGRPGQEEARRGTGGPSDATVRPRQDSPGH